MADNKSMKLDDEMIAKANGGTAEGGSTMDKKKLIPIVSMISVLIMFIWSFIEGSWNHSWLAVMAGGIVIVAIGMMGKDGEGG